MASQIVLFHFRCPLCGEKVKEVPLEIICELWARFSFADLKELVREVVSQIAFIGTGERCWSTKRFRTAQVTVLESYSRVFGDEELRGPLVEASSIYRKGHCIRDCPLCNSPAGIRTFDEYFTVWENSCKVQAANIMYESDLVIWGVLRAMPEWADGAGMTILNNFRADLRRVALSIGVLICPQCGRPVTCLFGVDAENSGYCRHCYDMAGGCGVSVKISVDENDEVETEGPGVDATAPAKASMDYMPPGLKRRKL